VPGSLAPASLIVTVQGEKIKEVCQMESIENRERHALEQIRRILAGLGPSSYIAEAIRGAFGEAAECQDTSGKEASPADELRQVRLPERTVQE